MKCLSHACLLIAFTFFHHSFFAQVTTVVLDVSTTVGDAEIRIGNGNVYNGNGVSANVSIPSKMNTYRFLMHFNYSAIPSNAVITSAILRLTPTTVGEGTVTISSFIANAITSNWHESTVTAANGTSVISANQQTGSTFVGGKREFDLKNMIQAAVNGTQPITGISIRRNPETVITNACQYHTKEATDITKRPKLTISYYIPFDITTVNINKASTLTSSNGSIAPTITGGSGSTTYQWINSSGQQIATTQTLTNRPFGWYGLKLTGILGDVYYMSFLIGVTCEPVTINFPNNNNYIDDANLASNAVPATTNFGNATNVLMGNDALSNRTSLLRFRVWMDQANEYADAKLYLFGNAHSTGSNAAVINRVTANWNELSVNNTNAPTFSTDLTVPLPSTATITENKILSVTEYFRYWTINPNQHFGFRFREMRQLLKIIIHQMQLTLHFDHMFQLFWMIETVIALLLLHLNQNKMVR